MTQDTVEDKVHARQVQLLYEQAFPGFVATIVSAILVGLIFFQVVETWLIILWISTVFLITVGRYVLVRQYNARVTSKASIAVDEYEKWSKYYMAGAALAGASWGLAGGVLVPIQYTGHQLIVMLAIAGMAAGAVPVLASVIKVYYAYLFSLLLPLFVWVAMQQHTPRVLTAMMIMVFVGILVSTARRIHSSLIQESRLHFEKESLLAEAVSSAERFEQANLELENEITRRRAAQRELFANNEFLEKVMDNTFSAIYAVDRNGYFTLVNKATANILGYSVEDLTGMHFMKLVASSSLARTEALFRRIVENGESVNGESIELVNRQGEIREIIFSQVPIREGAWITGAVGSAEDVTDQMLLRRLRTEFVSTVSHELRTPLTSICGSLGLISGGAAGEISDQAKGLVEIAHENSDRLLRLINDLLDIQKLESGKLHIQLENTRLVDVLELAVQNSVALADDKNVEIALEVSEIDRETTVLIDGDRFEQALSKLLSNAIKFSDKGEKVIIRTSNDGYHNIRVAVIDHGPGIPESFHKQIFEKFSRVDSSDTRNEGGSGLGLTIAQSLLENMNGSLSLESRPGEGCAFYISLPTTVQQGME